MKLSRNSNNIKRGFALLSTPILLTGVVYGFGGESIAEAAGSIPTATVASLATCAWTLAGVSPTVTMTAASAYSGASDLLTGTDSTADMYVSGDALKGTACSWYAATAAGATITLSIANFPSFTAVPAGLGYTFTAASPLTYTPSATGAGCPAATGSTLYTPRSMYGAANTGGTTVVINKTSTVIGTSTSCSFSPTYTSLIPAALTAGGLSTVLTGTSLTTTMTIT